MSQICRNVVVFLSVALLAGASFATGGRLNGSGCHNNKRIGYHCHRAQPVKKAVRPVLEKSTIPVKPSKLAKP